MKKMLALLAIAFAFALLAGCPLPPPRPGNVTNVSTNASANATDEFACSVDADCACGRHISNGSCFYGNKAFVDASRQCPDFCTGIAGNLEIKCVGAKCKQVQRQSTGFCGHSTNAACSGDTDCVSGGCSGQVCQGRSEDPVITTCEWSDCYNAGKYGLSCKCAGGKCGWA